MLMLLLQVAWSVVAHCVVAAVNCHEQFAHIFWFLAYQNFSIFLLVVSLFFIFLVSWTCVFLCYTYWM